MQTHRSQLVATAALTRRHQLGKYWVVHSVRSLFCLLHPCSFSPGGRHPQGLRSRRRDSGCGGGGGISTADSASPPPLGCPPPPPQPAASSGLHQSPEHCPKLNRLLSVRLKLRGLLQRMHLRCSLCYPPWCLQELLGKNRGILSSSTWPITSLSNKLSLLGCYSGSLYSKEARCQN